MSKIVETRPAVDFCMANAELLMQLACRWQDEKDYEDLNEYQARLQTEATKFGVTITKMQQRPFGCEFTVDGKTFVYTAKMNGEISYKRINPRPTQTAEALNQPVTKG